jgi:hypothetical protein
MLWVGLLTLVGTVAGCDLWTGACDCCPHDCKIPPCTTCVGGGCPGSTLPGPVRVDGAKEMPKADK